MERGEHAYLEFAAKELQARARSGDTEAESLLGTVMRRKGSGECLVEDKFSKVSSEKAACAVMDFIDALIKDDALENRRMRSSYQQGRFTMRSANRDLESVMAAAEALKRALGETTFPEARDSGVPSSGLNAVRWLSGVQEADGEKRPLHVLKTFAECYNGCGGGSCTREFMVEIAGISELDYRCILDHMEKHGIAVRGIL